MPSIFPEGQSWQQRLAMIVETMRELSSHTDPHEMVASYGKRMESIVLRDRLVTLSRRDQTHPEVRITRDSAAVANVNPWTQRSKLPLLRGGLLAELIYGDEPRVINQLDVPEDDPGYAYVGGYRSLMAIPLYDRGEALNMVLLLHKRPDAYRPEELPEQTWIGNLFGRATHNLVLSGQLREAYEAVDRELQSVATIQRSLLPRELPDVPNLDLAAYYETSRRAGGDYYDIIPLAGGKWGILIADVSGHGTPAAVLMAITQTLVRTHPEDPYPPTKLLERVNRQLTENYTYGNGTFVTAFYGVYCPDTKRIAYASAGHNPPRLKRCSDGSLHLLDDAVGFPMGIVDDAQYTEGTAQLQAGDQIVFYTDGITEAFDRAGAMFGTERLDEVLANCSLTAQGLLDAVLAAVRDFTDDHPADDDRTVIIARVR